MNAEKIILQDKETPTLSSAAQLNLPKKERICKKKIIDILFSKTSPSFSQYPIRIVYNVLSEEEETLQSEPVTILFSVSKRHFKRAVKRNRVKRQLREAYRHNKATLIEVCQQKEIKLSVAFLWLSAEIWDTEKIASKMQQIICRLINELSPREHTLNDTSE